MRGRQWYKRNTAVRLVYSCPNQIGSFLPIQISLWNGIIGQIEYSIDTVNTEVIREYTRDGQYLLYMYNPKSEKVGTVC